MFRSVADVVQKADLRRYAEAAAHERRPAAAHHRSRRARHSGTISSILAERIEAIEQRTRRVQKGDDILLSVITDGRHAAIDMRLVWPGNDDEPENKLNKLIANVHRIWQRDAARTSIAAPTARRSRSLAPGR